MTKKTASKALTASSSTAVGQRASASVESFSFGDDRSVIDGQSLWGYFQGAWINDRWYEPPVPFAGLAKSFRMSTHHESAVRLKVRLLTRQFIPSRWMSAATHARLALDYVQMGNGFLDTVPNLAGRPLRFERAPALYTRVGVKPGTFYWVKPDELGMGGTFGDHEFRPGAIHHLKVPDVEQEIYGLPEWLSAINSGLLNEAATLFRRRYFKNGGHAGFVFYSTSASLQDEDWEGIKQQMKLARGQGNFKNLFIHLPNGREKDIQIIPIAEVAAKDDFIGIKNVSRDDILAAHRTPPQLLGIIPQNNGGFGDVGKANDVFFWNEIEPLQQDLLELNEMIGLPVVAYKPYEPIGGQGVA